MDDAQVSTGFRVAPTWMRQMLRAAGVYNVAWGAWVVLFPGAAFTLAGIAPPSYPFIWQAVGMIVGVYGLGYWVAASDPHRHWPIILVGFLGKVFGPIGFVMYYVKGEISLLFGLNNVTNDLIWLIPFALVLRWVWRREQDRPAAGRATSR